MVDVHISRSAVIYLQSTKNTPGESRIRLHILGGEVEYTVPSILLKEYSLEQLFARELYILLPFYLLRYRNRYAEIEKDEEKIRNLVEELNEIDRRLEASVGSGQITIESADRISRELHQITSYLLKDRTNIMR